MKKRTKRILVFFSVIAILFFVSIIVYVPFLFYSFGSGFKTQEIIYKHKTKNETIEYQMDDLGAFGYSRRIVKVTEGTFSDDVEPIDTSKIDKSQWEEIKEYVNELGIKGG